MKYIKLKENSLEITKKDQPDESNIKEEEIILKDISRENELLK